MYKTFDSLKTLIKYLLKLYDFINETIKTLSSENNSPN